MEVGLTDISTWGGVVGSAPGVWCRTGDVLYYTVCRWMGSVVGADGLVFHSAGASILYLATWLRTFDKVFQTEAIHYFYIINKLITLNLLSGVNH